MRKYVLVCILLLSHATYAIPAMCSMSATGGLLDIFLQNYYNASQSWTGVLAPIATKLFWFWFTCEFLWQLTFKKILTNDLQKLYVFFVIRIFTAYFFAQCFVNPDFYLGIIQYLTNLGAQAGGFSVNPTSGNPFGTLSPSGIINIGLCSWNSLFAFLGANAGWASVVNAIIYAVPMIIMALLITLIAIIMALALVMLALESYIVLFGGFILCGFAGSSWTQSFWQKYLSYVSGIAIRFFVMCLILGLMKTQLNTLFAYIVSASSGSDYVTLIGVFFNTLICMIINAFIVLKVPAMAGAMLSGQVSGGLGDLMHGAAMVMSGANMIKSFGGGNNKTSALAQSALALGIGGASLADSGVSKMATTTASTAAKAAGEAGGKVASMSQNIGNKVPDIGNSAASTTKSEKLDALSVAKTNSSGLDYSTDQRHSSNGNSMSNDSNGITGGSGTVNTTPKPTSAKFIEAGKHLGKAAEEAGRMSGSGHSGGAELNINPHKE
ncbi:MAG: type IV secretion system protein [Burkholderiales bacterium]|nr:type IV secretion system protein [Burkholderiales bacterium]